MSRRFRTASQLSVAPGRDAAAATERGGRFPFSPKTQGQIDRPCIQRILLTGWHSLLNFGLVWRTLSSELNAPNLQGLKDWDPMLLDFNLQRRDSVSLGTIVSWPKTAPAHVAQLVEHVLGKDEVTGSIPVMGSMSASIETI